MSKNYLIKNVEIDCPICNKIHLLEKRKRLTQGILNCIKNISRDSVFNKEYSGSNLEDVISKA